MSCKPYCARTTLAKQCSRVDCMSCASCNASASAVAAAIARLSPEHNVSCDTDGGFEIPETRWPAPFHMLDEALARCIQGLAGPSPLL